MATYNPFLGKKKDLIRESKRKNFDLNQYNKLFVKEKKFFFQYKKLVELITNDLKKTVVIRPHPSESIQGWKDSLKDFKNVIIEREGDLLSWILASDFVIQNNCTSAIEATTVGIPVITYVDDHEDLLSYKGKENIPNKLSINIFGKDKFLEIINDIKSIWDKNENKISREILLKKKLKNYGTIKNMEYIAQTIIEYVGTPNPKGNENIGKDSILFDIYELFRKLRPKTKSAIMDINKRQTLSYDMVQKDIAHLLNIIKVDKKINMKRVRPNTFYLYPFGADSEK